MTAFRFKQFEVIQEKSAMKIGTDGVLLGAWASFYNPKNILDIGSGTGVISLMLAQRYSSAKIIGVEAELNAFTESTLNITNSPFKDRVEIVSSKIQEYNSELKFDLIVSNPPFFISSQKSGNEERDSARHTDGLSFEDLIKSVLNNLSANGIFAVVLPENEFNILTEIAEESSLYLSRCCFVYPNPNKPIKRVLGEFSFKKKGIKKEHLTIELDARHKYSEEYKALCKDFYLKF